MNARVRKGVTPARVLVVDDHPLLRRGLRSMIEEAPDLVVVAEAAGAAEALRQLRANRVDVATIDIGLQSGHGIELIKQIRCEFPRVKILVLSMYEASLFAERALRAGASGYLEKGEELVSVVEAIRRILEGRLFLKQEVIERTLRQAYQKPSIRRDSLESLSDREMEVFQLIGEGLTTRRIAERLSVSVKTIHTHRENLKRKLGLHSAGELSQAAFARKLASR